MQMLAIHRNNDRLGLLKWQGGLLALLLAILLSYIPSRAQDFARCGQSTVEDAWGPKMASEAKAFLAKLQHIVKTNDKKQFASLIHYPIRVYFGGHLTKISLRSDFVRKYSSIITPDVRHAILAQTPDCLFGNYQGMMIGNGQVWFQPESDGQMKVITINIDAPEAEKK